MAYRSSFRPPSGLARPREGRGWRQTVITVVVTVILGGVASVFIGDDGRSGAVLLAPPRPESPFEVCQSVESQSAENESAERESAKNLSADKPRECPFSRDLDESSVPVCPAGVRATGAPFALSAP